MCFQSSAMAAVSFKKTDDQILSPFDQTTAQILLSPLDTNRCSTKCCDREAAKRPELVEYDSLPEFLKDNEFIRRHYRSEWPLNQTVISIFSIHNETLNVWTHLIGFIIFLFLSGCAASFIPPTIGSANADPFFQFSTAGNSTHNFFIPSQASGSASPIYSNTPTPISRWPFYLYLAGVMFCLLMSSACHLLSCHSSRMSYVMLRLDFAGISGLIVSSFYTLAYYPFACDPFFRNLYLGSITAFGLAVVIVSFMPVFDSPQFRPVRAVLFACMAASGIVPIAHKMMVFGDRPEAVLTTGYEAMMGVLYGLGVVVYAARVPERWLPGKFDLAGHSHQLFHVLVVAGAYMHYLASSVYLAWREAEGC